MSEWVQAAKEATDSKELYDLVLSAADEIDRLSQELASVSMRLFAAEREKDAALSLLRMANERHERMQAVLCGNCGTRASIDSLNEHSDCLGGCVEK